MKRAYSVQNVMDASFKEVKTSGEWYDAIGTPEFGGSWMIYGNTKNGKTSLALKLAHFLAESSRVAYDSVEEGLSLSFKDALKRARMGEVARRFILLDKEGVTELTERLSRRCSPDVVFIDSVQFLGLTWAEYKGLKARFPHKLFIYVSHVDGAKPEGVVAQRIWKDCNVYFRVEGFRAFPTSRYGGNEPIDVDKSLAESYWGLK